VDEIELDVMLLLFIGRQKLRDSSALKPRKEGRKEGRKEWGRCG